jgi:hypothetical protein
VDELLESHSSELANEDLLEMENKMDDESQKPFFTEPTKLTVPSEQLKKMILMRLEVPKLREKFKILWLVKKNFGAGIA